jgi:hypothetical protein
MVAWSGAVEGPLGKSTMTASPAAMDELGAVNEFVGQLRCLTSEQLTTMARESRGARATVAGDIDWWRATAVVSRDLRRLRRSRRAAVESLRASEAVLAAPGAAEVPHDQVVHAARAASEVARALVAGARAAVCATFVPGWQALGDKTAPPIRPNAA